MAQMTSGLDKDNLLVVFNGTEDNLNPLRKIFEKEGAKMTYDNANQPVPTNDDHKPKEDQYQYTLRKIKDLLRSTDPTDASPSFNRLRDANVRRTADSYRPVSDWSPTDWACAAAGEMGEVCNLIKKLRRSEGDGVEMADVADEMADVIIYLDLLAYRLTIDLGAAVKRKFNKTSDEVASSVKL